MSGATQTRAKTPPSRAGRLLIEQENRAGGGKRMRGNEKSRGGGGTKDEKNTIVVSLSLLSPIASRLEIRKRG